MCSVHPVFHMSMLEPAISNSFSKRTSTLVIIEGEPKYKISQIVDSKINCWWTCIRWSGKGTKTLETNLSRFLYLNLLIPLTWYLISILHILLSLVYFHCPDHTVALIFCLCALLTRNSFIIFLVYSICLLSINLSFYAPFTGVLFKFLDFYFYFCLLIFYSHSIATTENKIKFKTT